MKIQKSSFLFFHLAVTCSDAWVLSGQSSSGRGLLTALKMAEDDESFHNVQVTTKTNKQIIFDANLGRFFETSLDPTFSSSNDPLPAAATFFYEVPTEISKLPAFSSNEMVPTNVLFGIKSTQMETKKEDLPELVAAMEETVTSSPEPEPQQIQTVPATSIVEKCYAAWNQRDMSAVADCFDDRFVYEDSQYLGTITSKATLIQHIENQANLLPANSQLVPENIAVDPTITNGNLNIGTQWYIQKGGERLAFTKGCTFYQINSKTGLIKSGFRVSEMIVKPSKQVADRLVSSASRLIMQSSANSSPAKQQESTANKPIDSCIIEEYFEAWNCRDMESALDCFTDDCVYQTEDPVFVDTFEGKAALRAHLEKNAAALPSSCKIILDKTAVDSERGTIGTVWHFQVNGIAIPNLRGCSMYTTDLGTGLLKSGFDVTEAPMKIPRQLLASRRLLSLPASALFGQQ